MKIYKHIPLEREMMKPSHTWRCGNGGEVAWDSWRMEGESRKWWKNGEEDEDGVERKWRRERKVKVMDEWLMKLQDIYEMYLDELMRCLGM